jgi:conjugal transfer/entry exclusion protein
MRGCRWWLLISLLWIVPVQAQTPTPVIEMGLNLVQNTITASQSVIHTAKWLLELARLPSFVLLQGEFAEDLLTLQRLVADGQAIGMDVRSLEAQLSLFNLASAPMTSQDYRRRMGEIRVQVFQGYSYAMRTQTLIATTLRTVQHMTKLLRDVSDALGGMQSSQTLAQHQGQLIQVQSELKLQTAAFQHAEAVEQLAAPLTEQAMENINQSLWADWEAGDVGL